MADATTQQAQAAAAVPATGTLPAAQLQQILGLLSQQQGGMAAGAPMQQQGMGMMPAGQLGMVAAPAPIGISVQINIPLPDGSLVRGQLQLPTELLANAAMIPQVVAMLAQQWPIDVFTPGGNRGGGWGNNRGGGYQRNGGGYGRGRW